MSGTARWPDAVRLVTPASIWRWNGHFVDIFTVEEGRLHLALARQPGRADAYRLLADFLERQFDIAAPDLRRTAAGAVEPVALPDVTVSIARAGSRTLIGIARGARLGVDLETRARVAAAATLEDRWLSTNEREDCRSAADPAVAMACRWVLKEALGKALGTGLPADPAAWPFRLDQHIAAQAPDMPDRAAFWLGSYDKLLLSAAYWPLTLASRAADHRSAFSHA